MKWKQFFTPVESLDSTGARDYLTDKDPDEVTLLDVRQPKEYAAGHLPGAKLIPLPELPDRLSEIDPEKPTIVY
jgi:sulfur-carrier protein adenylyltransferase/sulfurtransferase